MLSCWPAAKLERPGDRQPVELHRAGVLVVAGLHLDPGDQGEADVFDIGRGVPTAEVDLAVEHQTGPGVRVGQHRVHARTTDTEGA